MTNQPTLDQRFRDLRREPVAPDWLNVLQRAGVVAAAGSGRAGDRLSTSWVGRMRTTRRATLIAFAAAIIALGLAGVAYSLTRPTLPFTAPTPEAAEEATRKAPGTEEKIHDAARVDGQTWNLRSYDNVRGDLCFTHEVPGELVGTGCMPAEKLFKRGPLHVLHGARQIPAPYPKLEWDNQWVYGIAHPDIKWLTLVHMDCSTVALPLDEDGAFHHVVGQDDIRNGRQQYKLIARGARGELLAERVVAKPPPRNAKNAGIEAPRPRAACR